MADKKISALTGATTPLAGTEVLPIVQGGSTVKVAVSDLTAGRAVGANGLTSTANIRVQYSAAGNVSSVANNTAATAGSMSQLITTNDASRSLRVQYSASGGAGGSALTNGISTETAQVFTDGNYPIVFGTNVSAALILDTSQNAKIINNLIIGTAAKGIDFSANTHAAGMTSELLNDYEEGTWTPTDGSGAGLSFTGTSGNCFYTKVGNLVTCVFALVYPTTVSALGAKLTGLPFTSKSTSSSVAGGYVTFSNASLNLNFLVGAGDTNINIYLNTGGAATNAQLSTFILRGVITYMV
jgi:hypothetical protein